VKEKDANIIEPWLSLNLIGSAPIAGLFLAVWSLNTMCLDNICVPRWFFVPVAFLCGIGITLLWKRKKI